MVTAPGAAAQHFHRDVAPAVVSCSSLTASLQISLVDTAATQGPLELIPGSHAFDAAVSDRTLLDESDAAARSTLRPPPPSARAMPAPCPRHARERSNASLVRGLHISFEAPPSSPPCSQPHHQKAPSLLAAPPPTSCPSRSPPAPSPCTRSTSSTAAPRTRTHPTGPSSSSR
eukprot:3466595-Prymnesium_polylepis.1